MVSSCQRVKLPEGVRSAGFSAMRQRDTSTASTKASMSVSSVRTARSVPPPSVTTIFWALENSSALKSVVTRHPAIASRHSRAARGTHRRLVMEMPPFQQVRAHLS